MEMQEVISKLSERVFIKKSTGQPYEKEERALREIEDHFKQETAEHEALISQKDKNEKALEKSQARIEELKAEVVRVAREWRDAALELFRAERDASDLWEEIIGIYKKLYGPDRIRLKVKDFPKSILLGSPRARWVDDELDVLSEEFRRELIRDNRAHHDKLRGKLREQKRRKPINGNPAGRFIPEQYEVFMDLNLPVPSWWHDAYKGYQEKKKEYEEKTPTGFEK